MPYSEYKNFGKVYKIRKDNLTVMVTVDIGPRIIYFGDSEYNLLYEDISRQFRKGGEYFDKNYFQGAEWLNLGGHRLWKSPEDLASYSPDNTPVTVQERGNAVAFIKQAEKTIGLIKEIEIEILSDNRLRVEHRFTNTRNEPVECALWALTVLRGGGTLITPLNANDKGLLPSRNLVLWSYSDYHDGRFEIRDDTALLTQKAIDKPFKFGMFSEKGVSGYLVDGRLFVKTFDVNPYGVYPDFQCNFESYTNYKFIECESLGELITLNSGETSTHTEVWYYNEAEDIGDAAAIINNL
ncbi:MAG: hypothetical protein ACOX3U_06420 [Christensenellales bacterium]|jgi:hypothetical protein